jgi:hypothetical protein
VVLAIDASTPAVATNPSGATTQAFTTASFTPPANSLLVIMYASDGGSPETAPTPVITDNLGTHLTYFLRVKSNVVTSTRNGQATIWTAPVLTSAPMTITITSSSSVNPCGQACQPVVVTDSGNLPTIGGNSNAPVTGTSYSVSNTASANGSWSFAVFEPWNAGSVQTAGAGTTIISSGTTPVASGSSSDIDYAFARRTTADGVNGVSNPVNINSNLSQTSGNSALIEIIGTAGGAATPATTGVEPHSRLWWPGRGPRHNQRGHSSPAKGTTDTRAKSSATLVSTLDNIATDVTLPTTSNSNISASVGNAANQILSSTTLVRPHGKASVTRYSISTADPGSMVGWDVGKWTGQPTGNNLYSQMYLYLESIPAATIGIWFHGNTSWTGGTTIRLNLNGRLAGYAVASTLLGTMNTILPVGRWVRVGVRTFIDPVIGFHQIRLFTSPESLIPTEDFTTPLGNTQGALAGITRVAIGNNGGGTTANIDFADVSFSDTDWLLPVGTVRQYIGWGMGVNT